MSQFIEHISCPSCGSSDGLAIYQQEDGTHNGTCFVCNKYCPNPYGESKPMVLPVQQSQSALQGIANGGTYELTDRGIRADVAEHFGVKVALNQVDGVTVTHHYYPLTKDNQLVAYKMRDVAVKDFRHIGDSKGCELFGQSQAQLVGGKKLWITEGECDAMALYQAIVDSQAGTEYQHHKPSVVSVVNGSSGAKKELLAQSEFLNRYEQIILCFDNDAPGKEATTECAMALPAGKARILKLPAQYKDANKMLQEGQAAGLAKAALWNSQEYRPDSIVTLADLRDRLLVPKQFGISWPWDSLTKATYGIRPSELIMIGAGSGSGKSTLMVELIHHLVSVEKQGVAAFFLEESAVTTGQKLAGLRANKQFHLPSTESNSYTSEELQTYVDEVITDNHVYLHDGNGVKNWESMQSDIRHLSMVSGVQHIIIDPITALTACEEDERRALDAICAELSSLAESLEVTIYVVSHLTRQQSTNFEEGGQVSQRSFRGSGSLQFWSNLMLGLERNTQAESEVTRNYSKLRVLKDRYSGQSVGVQVPLYYNSKTGRLLEATSEQQQLVASQPQEQGASYATRPEGIEIKF